MPRSPLSSEQFSFCSQVSCTGALGSTAALRRDCFYSPSSTCSCFLRQSCSTTGVKQFHPRARRTMAGTSDHCMPTARQTLFGAGASPSTSARSDMRYGLLAVALIAVATLGGCTDAIFDPKGPVALAERQILLNALGIMLAIVIPVIVATLGVAFWFRASNDRARYRPNFAYSGRLEMLVWSIPAMTVFLVGGVAWVSSHDVSPRKPIASTVKPLRVQVASLDWKWLFIYPDQGVASVNRLTIPVGTPVSLELTSSGVMNSFFVPQLGSQIYTMAGMITHLNLLAEHSGTYRGFSAQFSGEGFSDMHFDADAVT